MLGIPLKYNVRNLFVRKVTTTLTVLGIALVVAVFLCVMALGEGLTRVFTASGSEKNVLVLRQNSQSELQSGLGRDQIPLIRALPGIEKDADGKPLVSAELVVVLNLDKRDGGSSNVTIRGVEEKGMALRPADEADRGADVRPGDVGGDRRRERREAVQGGRGRPGDPLRRLPLEGRGALRRRRHRPRQRDLDRLGRDAEHVPARRLLLGPRPDDRPRRARPVRRRRRGGRAPRPRGKDRAGLLRRADLDRRADQVPRRLRRHRHGDRRLLRRDEHDVRGGLLPDARDRDAPRPRLLATLDPRLVRPRVDRPRPPRGGRRLRARVPPRQGRPLGRHRHDELRDVRRGRLRLPADALSSS